MDIKLCKDCEIAKTQEYYGVYNITCFGCRERILLSEPCKITREVMAESMRRWGEIPNWKVEPTCGCKYSCERLHQQRLAMRLN